MEGSLMREKGRPSKAWSEHRVFAEFYYHLHRQHLLAMPPERAFSLWKMAQTLQDVPGDIAELGVYRGGSAFLLGKALPGKALHLFDSFTGLPDPAPMDLHAKGDFAGTSRAKTAQLLSFTQAIFHVGYFPETFQHFSSPLALVHLDADLYASTKSGLEAFWPLLSPGGLMIGDDYGWAHCPGVKQAFDEFCQHNKRRLEFSAQYQCVVRKD
jgi:predicted O-methyltransferase YrrM